jgi:WD40 repeat protein
MSRGKRWKLAAIGCIALTTLTILLLRTGCTGRRPDEAEVQRVTVLTGHRMPVQALAFVPDGATLTSAACNFGFSERGVEVAIWDVGSGNLAAKHREYPGALRSLAIAPDGRRLAATVQDREVVLWDVLPWRERARLAVPTLYGSTIALTEDETQLATTDFEHGVTVWDADKGRARSSCKAQTAQIVVSLAFARGGAILAGGGASDRHVWLWNPATGEEICALRGHDFPVVALSFSLDGRLLASGDCCGAVRLWDVTAKKLRANLMASEDNFLKAVAVAFSSDGKTLAVAVDRTVQLWDVTTERLLATLRGHEGQVNCLAYSPDGTLLASGGHDRTVRLWDVTRYRSSRP